MPKKTRIVSLNTRLEYGAEFDWEADIVTASDAQIRAEGYLLGTGQTIREALEVIRAEAAREMKLPILQVEVVSHRLIAR